MVRLTKENEMKKLFLITSAAAALILAGCDKGGTSDQYGTSSDNVTSSNSLQHGNPADNATSNADHRAENTGTATR
jgi:hypothetical protein